MSDCEWNIPRNQRIYLRELARKQAHYAALPVMQERRKIWYDLNDGLPNARPPVVIETGTFNRDFMPEGLLKCQSPAAREIEHRLLEVIRWHECIDDDKVIPDRFEIFWNANINVLGFDVPRERVKDSQGYELGFHYQHPIVDLKRDIHKLRAPICTVDRQQTYAYKAFLEDLLGDLLPVEIRSGMIGRNMLTDRVVELMGMEAFFVAMYDAPDQVHQLMDHLANSYLQVGHWAESEGLLRLNNANQKSFGSSYGFTTLLPGPDYAGGPARLSEIWGAANSQETVGISPAMFHDFCAPYYHKVCQPLGLVYWGCCEPAHPLWDDIQTFPHLKKVSISRWCDEQFMADALRGTKIVYSRKPNPNLLGVDVNLDEDAWRQGIRTTLNFTKDVLVEFIVRDVYTVHGNLAKPRRAVQIAREEIDKARGA